MDISITASSPINTGTSLPEPPDETQASHKSRVGPIVGGIIGGIACIVLVAVVMLFLRRQRASSGSLTQHDVRERGFWSRHLGALPIHSNAPAASFWRSSSQNVHSYKKLCQLICLLDGANEVSNEQYHIEPYSVEPSSAGNGPSEPPPRYQEAIQ